MIELIIVTGWIYAVGSAIDGFVNRTEYTPTQMCKYGSGEICTRIGTGSPNQVVVNGSTIKYTIDDTDVTN